MYIALLDACFFFQAEDGIRDHCVTGVQTCALPIYTRGRELAVLVCGLAASGVAVHGSALAASLQASRKSSRLGHRVGLLFFFPAAAVGLLTLASAGKVRAETIEWYGHDFESIRFYSALAVVLALCAVLAAYREIARELKLRLLPWAYPAFAIFLAILFAGFGMGPARTRTTLALSALVVSLGL